MPKLSHNNFIHTIVKARKIYRKRQANGEPNTRPLFVQHEQYLKTIKSKERSQIQNQLEHIYRLVEYPGNKEIKRKFLTTKDAQNKNYALLGSGYEWQLVRKTLNYTP